MTVRRMGAPAAARSRRFLHTARKDAHPRRHSVNPELYVSAPRNEARSPVAPLVVPWGGKVGSQTDHADADLTQLVKPTLARAGERGWPCRTALAVCSAAFCGARFRSGPTIALHQSTNGEHATRSCIPFRLVLVAT